jgi:hypothetical protein
MPGNAFTLSTKYSYMPGVVSKAKLVNHEEITVLSTV